ncbi:MAG: hypothetical protein AB7K41_15970 [Bdellovibrionales bacterium]
MDDCENILAPFRVERLTTERGETGYSLTAHLLDSFAAGVGRMQTIEGKPVYLDTLPGIPTEILALSRFDSKRQGLVRHLQFLQKQPKWVNQAKWVFHNYVLAEKDYDNQVQAKRVADQELCRWDQWFEVGVWHVTFKDGRTVSAPHTSKHFCAIENWHMWRAFEKSVNSLGGFVNIIAIEYYHPHLDMEPLSTQDLEVMWDLQDFLLTMGNPNVSIHIFAVMNQGETLWLHHYGFRKE